MKHSKPKGIHESSSQSQVEYLVHSRIGEKGQITIPKQYREELGLNTGSPVAVLRIGAGLMLIPEQNRFRLLCDSIASVLERRRLSPADLLDTLPAARQRVFVRHYPELVSFAKRLAADERD